MLSPDPFMPTSIAAGVLTNLAYDILKQRSKSLEDTLVGHMLKGIGLIEPGLDEQLRDNLDKALKLYFQERHSDELTGVAAFFRNPLIARQVADFILDRQQYDPGLLQRDFDRHLNSDPMTKALMKRRGLSAENLIKEFLKCYRKVLSEQMSVPQMSVLLEVLDQSDVVVLEIKASEERLKEYIANLLETRLSAGALNAAYQSGQQGLVVKLARELEVDKAVKANQNRQTIPIRAQSLPSLFIDGLCRGRIPASAPNQYFVSHGFDRDTLADWREMLNESLTNIGSIKEPVKPFFSGDELESGFRLCRICEKLYGTRFSVFLLPPSKDRNVYLELGIAIGLGVPFFLIQHYEAQVPPILEGLGRYMSGGLFVRMRHELAGKIEEYDFGVVRFFNNEALATTGCQQRYIIAAGELTDEKEFEYSIISAIRDVYPHLEALPITQLAKATAMQGWELEQFIEAIQTSHFAIYRVDEQCSPTTFLALGISIALNRPFLMVHGSRSQIPQDLRGIGIYKFPNFLTLKREIIPTHRLFFDKYARQVI